jgi:hypothetical protein
MSVNCVGETSIKPPGDLLAGEHLSLQSISYIFAGPKAEQQAAQHRLATEHTAPPERVLHSWSPVRQLSVCQSSVF